MTFRFTFQRWALLLVAALLCQSSFASAQDRKEAAKPGAEKAADEKPAGDTAAEEKQDDILPEGHSSHGEIFNEGPRQAAYLMDGIGEVRFDVTSSSEDAKAFVRQGVGQLHGFWYFESERSFRQAATLDPDCAIAYWGMAMSNKRNTERARGFIKEAMERKDKASRHEQMWIESFNTYINAKAGSTDEKKRRAKKYISDLENILFEFPNDTEAKAFMCEFLWSGRRSGIDMGSYYTVDALIEEVLNDIPLHPIHHYRIHLWDTKKPEKALESAALCGLSSPSIAHMWHMPGHIYSRLKRYHDAVYQQEASARVDHAHMMKDLVLPDQIHNFAHNNEWCIRNLIHIGRVQDAMDLARNMIQLPRHPKYNHIGKFGSYKYGRQRLLGVLRTFELHKQMVSLAQTPYLEKSGNATEDLKTERYVGAAYAALGQKENALEIRNRMDKELTDQKANQKKAGDDAEKKARDEKKNDKDAKRARSTAEGKFRTRVRELENSIREIDGRIALHEGRAAEALDLLTKAGGIPTEELVRVMVAAGKKDEAIKKITDYVNVNKNEVRPLAAQVEVLWACEKKEEAKTALKELQKISGVIDQDLPAFAGVDRIAKESGIEGDWRQPLVVADDIGARPPLNSLGPFRWQPITAADWQLPDVENKTRSLDEFKGKPTVVIFYLGAGCLHCAEQLQKFAPRAKEFEQAGLQLVAISTDKQEILHRAYEALDEEFPFPLVSDAKMDVFKAYRCFDDFEQVPLHGTFLLDPNGKVRWQDISYEPFMDPDFVLKESVRLLGQDSWETETDSGNITADTGAE